MSPTIFVYYPITYRTPLAPFYATTYASGRVDKHSYILL